LKLTVVLLLGLFLVFCENGEWLVGKFLKFLANAERDPEFGETVSQ
jgi:hypothetical protein